MKQLFSSLVFLLFVAAVWAQAPHAINYQGVARNASGVPYAGQQINVRLTIHTGTPDGTVEYSETRSVTTNQFGLFNVQIGSAGMIAISGVFSTINWGTGTKFLQTEISVNGQPYTNLGTTQMMSVPFALHSREAKDLVFPFSKTGLSVTEFLHLTNNDNTATSATIKATATAGRAIFGNSSTGTGGYFVSNSGTAVFGYAPNGTGVTGVTNSASDTAVAAINNGDGVALSVKGGLRIYDGNTNPGTGKVLTSDASGNATWQHQQTIAFRASGLRDNVKQAFPPYVNKKVLFYQQARYNVGDAYNAENSIFFPPVASVYHLNVQVDWFDQFALSHLEIKLLRGGQVSTIAETYNGTYDPDITMVMASPSLTLDIALQPNDAVWIELSQSPMEEETIHLAIQGYKSWFSGHLVTRL